MATKAEIEAERDALRADIAIISDRLRDEAETRSWCAEYGEVMEAINSETSEPHMQQCRKQQLEGVVTIRFSELTVDLEPGEDPSDAVSRWMQANVISEQYALDGVRFVELDD